ncbi:hypothetical protein [Kingella sp. (in: b-proteobacteria)]|uniref:hypothetical protein n=1 Tax=Kingella sp. (in: b-proteobacteria) TaxID=2020713 RepID=UPI0026DD4679|nr:hypothetical protein [Kingella sp. (in: b-proteobacteria)]MDO4658057.1 hypothetical protein [Kingella sp. (in: b-proteobacteria)]
MERRRLADILLINETTLNQLFGDEPSPLHFGFQAALASYQGSLKTCSHAHCTSVSGCLALFPRAQQC